MNEAARKVMVGFCSLTPSERQEVIRAINEYEKESWRQGELREKYRSVRAVPTGPVDSGSCPCCGR